MDLDREFMQRVYARCGPSLDIEVLGDDVADELGLSDAEARDVLARLIRTGHLRESGGGSRVKITIRGIASAEHETGGALGS